MVSSRPVSLLNLIIFGCSVARPDGCGSWDCEMMGRSFWSLGNGVFPVWDMVMLPRFSSASGFS